VVDEKKKKSDAFPFRFLTISLPVGNQPAVGFLLHFPSIINKKKYLVNNHSIHHAHMEMLFYQGEEIITLKNNQIFNNKTKI
jgi:hypothetical protein